MSMDARAQANTFWIIIGAVIALVVMVVLLLLFTGKTNVLEQGLVDCEAKGGQCVVGESCYDGQIKQNFFDCSGYEGDRVCCLGTASDDT
jgi:hypothetical protein